LDHWGCHYVQKVCKAHVKAKAAHPSDVPPHNSRYAPRAMSQSMCNSSEGTARQQPGVPRKTPSSARPTIREPQGGAPPERPLTKGNKNDIQHEWKMPKPFQQEELRLELLASSELNPLPAQMPRNRTCGAIPHAGPLPLPQCGGF
jgi:hypothetical protein